MKPTEETWRLEVTGDEQTGTVAIVGPQWPGINADGLVFVRSFEPWARMMAAAPELYRALEAAFLDEGGSMPVGWYDMARAALTKARGES